MSEPAVKPKRGEVWRVALDPVIGSEQAKTRPVVVMSGGNIGRPAVRVCVPLTGFQTMRLLLAHWRVKEVCVPLTGFQTTHLDIQWCVPIAPETTNGLTKPSTADASQIRALDIARFEAKLGKLAKPPVEAVAAAVAFCVGYETS